MPMPSEGFGLPGQVTDYSSHRMSGAIDTGDDHNRLTPARKNISRCDLQSKSTT